MSINNLEKASVAAGVGLAAAGEAGQGDAAKALIGGIRDSNAEVRTQAWLSAGEVGAPAVGPLGEVMTDDDLEIARAAKRAMWKIVRHVGRPRAIREKRAVETELIGLLGDDQPVSVRREVVWMLSEIGARNSIRLLARLTRNAELREDARMALERIGNGRAIQVLRNRFEAAPEEFKPNLAQSLRKLGVEVEGYPCQKLVPTKQTNLKPL
ncbi:MAG: HEAT repeat domain-containing protein [Sedimentisphaerales bacterium]